MSELLSNELLKPLVDLLVGKVKFVFGASLEVEEDLKKIHHLMMQADKCRSRNDSKILRDCMVELRELSDKAQMVLETYEVEIESKKRKFDRFKARVGAHHLDEEIKDIRSRLADLIKDFPSIEAAGSSNSAPELHQSRITYSHEPVQYFVGMEEDIGSVVNMVKDGSPDSPSVISICGLGGLGKTTLAKKVYNHPDIRARFNSRAWVCVTQQLQAETILREIFQQIVGSKPDKGETHDGLVRGLNKGLVQRKCFIVIDDIWETHHWEILKKAFPRGNCKVMLTTRNEKIASHECRLHKLDFMTEDEGWELLGKIALPHGQVIESDQFEKIGRKMVRECGRLPLGISVIGGILRGKQQIWAWEEVSRNMDIYLNNGGEGMGDYIRVKHVLDLSFDVLPYYLKPCFLYLASFPEDHDIDTERLYLLWLAEGLISSEERGKNESLRDVAERYLTELALRCMVQVKKGWFITPFKKFTSCRLHDLMRDLCSSKAEHEKFIKQVDISQHQQDITSTIRASVHRLAINVVDEDVTLHENCLHEVKDLRSLLVLQKEKYGIRTQSCYLNAINLENSKHLRILGVDGVSVDDGKFTSGIVKLIYLKYLSFFDCPVNLDNILELSEDVCYLPFLQTLDLRVRHSMKLPNLIWKMKRLRHLFLPEFIHVIGGGKLRLAGLKELETLEGIDNKYVCIADIINLTNLRTLRAKIWEEDVDILSEIVDFMTFQLREADLEFWYFDLKNLVEKILMMRSLIRLAIYSCKIGRSFPPYKQGMCENLVKLTLSNVKIGIDVMEAFDKNPILNPFSPCLKPEEWMVEIRFGANSFLELKELVLHDLMNLHKLEVENGAMPQLRRLSISRCKNLKKLPDGLRFISSLHAMTFYDMSENFKSRLMKGGEDDGKFSHFHFLD